MVEVKVYNKGMTVVSNCMWMDGGGKTRLSNTSCGQRVAALVKHPGTSCFSLQVFQIFSPVI